MNKELVGHQSFVSTRKNKSINPTSKNNKKIIASDYIKVLQEQIYFLEMENALLKKQVDKNEKENLKKKM